MAAVQYETHSTGITVPSSVVPSSANTKALPRLFWISFISQCNRVTNFVEIDKGLKARLRL